MKADLLLGHPSRVLVLGFVLLIGTGAVLLALPPATTQVGSAGFVDALFTSTSAVCGGLTVLDTGADFSPFGRGVLLFLIQMGGLGIMLSSTALLALFGVKLGLKERVILQDHETGFTLAAPHQLARQVLLYTLAVESLGFVLLRWWCGQDAFAALFHSISAFCNAGFALPRTNLMQQVDDVPVNLVLMLLMLLGSLGYVTYRDVLRRLQGGRLTLHTRLVLTATLILTLAGSVLFLLFEWNNPKTVGGLEPGGRVLASLFASVSARTTGFYTVDYGQLHEGTLLMTVLLMGVGGAPGSTAGGIKVTTAALLVMAAYSQVRGREQVVVWQRCIPQAKVLQALGMVVLFSSSVIVLALALQYLEPFTFHKILFESASALGTAGLSTGITPQLSGPSKLLIALGMLVGRLGPVTMAVSLVRREKQPAVRYPTEEVAIG